MSARPLCMSAIAFFRLIPGIISVDPDSSHALCNNAFAYALKLYSLIRPLKSKCVISISILEIVWFLAPSIYDIRYLERFCKTVCEI